MSLHTSPRIQALQEEIAQGNTSALAVFWQEMEEQGTPLYEPLRNEPDHCLVTFLWRGDKQTHNVVLIGALASYMDGLHFAERQMDHLEGTDMWYKTYRVHHEIHTSYQFSPNDPLIEPQETADWLARFSNFRPDPLNPLQLISPKDEEVLDSYSGTSSIARRNIPSTDWAAMTESEQIGRLEQHRLRSQLLHNERRIWVYMPPGYDVDRAQPYHLLFLFDGFDALHVTTPPAMLDALLTTLKIPPLVAVFIDNLGQQVRNRELPCYQPFIDFLVQELVPWIQSHYHVTNDPQRTIISGSSYGGLAATFAGFQASHMFGNIVAQSGSFWWKPDHEDEEEWIIKQFEQAPQLPLHFSLQAGKWEPILPSIRHLYAVLHAKGYAVHYHEFEGGHEDLAWQTLFPLALQQLVKDWL